MEGLMVSINGVRGGGTPVLFGETQRKLCLSHSCSYSSSTRRRRWTAAAAAGCFTRPRLGLAVRMQAAVSSSSSSSNAAIPGLSSELTKIAQQNMDQAPDRRRVRQAFSEFQHNLDHCLFKRSSAGLKTEEKLEINSRGLEIFNKCWIPEDSSIKGIVFFCHGYGDTCTYFFEGIAKKIAAAGYGIFSMDYPGFGLSEGLHGYIPSFERIVEDVIEQFSKIKKQPEFSCLPSFIFGQSMGGAVALKVQLKEPSICDGTIVVAPMCKIKEDVTPPWQVLKALEILAWIFPKQKLFPQKDMSELSFRDIKKREMTLYNVIAYKDQMRLRTAMEILRTTAEIERTLKDVAGPLLILHGDADQVTDPDVSKALYEKCRSDDKTIKLYEGGYHSILEGEPDERIFEVLNDIIAWLDARSIKSKS